MARGDTHWGLWLLLVACASCAHDAPDSPDLAVPSPDLAVPSPDLAVPSPDLAVPSPDLAPPALIFDNPRSPPGACGPMWLMDIQSYPAGITCGQVNACAWAFPAGSAVRLYEQYICGGVRLDHWTDACTGTKGTICNTFMGSGITYAGVALVIEGLLTIRNSSGVDLRVSDDTGVNGPCQSGFGGYGVPSRCNANPCCVTADLGATRKLHTQSPVRWGGACTGTSQDCQVTITGLIEVTAAAP